MSNVITACGHRTPVLGVYTLHFEIAGKRCQTRVNLIDDLEHDLILGVNFLKKYQAILDCAENLLTIRDPIIVAPARKVFINPRSTVLIKGIGPSTCGGQNLTGLTVHVNEVRLEEGVTVQPCIATLNRNIIPLVINNTSNKRVYLDPNKTNIQCEFVGKNDQVYNIEPVINKTETNLDKKCNMKKYKSKARVEPGRGYRSGYLVNTVEAEIQKGENKIKRNPYATTDADELFNLPKEIVSKLSFKKYSVKGRRIAII